MPRPFYFGERSEAKLITCHKDLQVVMRSVIQFYDIAIIWGWRGEELQNHFFDIGTSTKAWPDSTHNTTDEDGQPLSRGVDIAPWFDSRPHIRWNNANEFTQLAGRVLQVADMLSIPLTWGGDWDRDDDLNDQTFYDLGHFQLYEDY